MSEKKVYLPYSVYKNIVDHLSVHASTDSWAESCLKQLEEESEIREPISIPKFDRNWKDRFAHEVALMNEELEK